VSEHEWVKRVKEGEEIGGDWSIKMNEVERGGRIRFGSCLSQ
jgi:hypothetical protein